MAASMMHMATGVSEVDGGQWFQVFSNLVFFIPAYVAGYRKEFLRALGFVAVAFVSGLYHLCNDSPACEGHKLYRELDHWLSQWMSVTIVLLFAAWPAPGWELVVEVAMLGLMAATVWWWIDIDNDTETMYAELFFPIGTAISIVPLTWVTVSKGLPPVHWCYVTIGLGLVVGALIFFFVEPLQDEELSHGTWHIVVGFAAAVLIYGTRDKDVQFEYNTL